MKPGSYFLLNLIAVIGCTPSSSEPAGHPQPAEAQAVGEDSSPEADTNRARATAVVGDAPADPAQTGLPAGTSSAEASNSTVEVTFDDIQLPIQADMVFRPFMISDRVKKLEGRKIRISGYMLPDVKTKGITQFVLLKNTECKFGPGGPADHLINVLMIDGVTARFRDTPVSVEGVLKINPFQGPDGNTWSIYDLACDRVETYRRRH